MQYFTVCLLYLLIFGISITTAQNQIQMADFDIFQNTAYDASVSNSLITNITGRLASSLTECAQQCLNHVLCQTATHYGQLQICSLYGEKYNLGQLVNTGTQETSVLSLNNKIPSGKRKDRH